MFFLLQSFLLLSSSSQLDLVMQGFKVMLNYLSINKRLGSVVCLLVTVIAQFNQIQCKVTYHNLKNLQQSRAFVSASLITSTLRFDCIFLLFLVCTFSKTVVLCLASFKVLYWFKYCYDWRQSLPVLRKQAVLKQDP